MTEIPCPDCGKPLKRPGTHFARKHATTARELREDGYETCAPLPTCPKGHAMIDGNVRTDPVSGVHVCMTCHRDMAARHRERHHAELLAKKRDYYVRPEVQARLRAYRSTPEFRARDAERRRARRAAKRADAS